MHEHYYVTDNIVSFLKHSSLQDKRKTLLFIHGIGDSSLGLIPSLNSPALQSFQSLYCDRREHHPIWIVCFRESKRSS